MSSYSNYGYKSLKDMQKCMNLDPDGIWGPKSAEADKLLGSLVDEALLVRRELYDHDFNMRDMTSKPLCSAVQEMLAFLGYKRQLQYDRFGADGIWGGCSNAALSAFMGDSGHTDKDEAITDIGSRLVDLYPNDYLGELVFDKSETDCSKSTFTMKKYVRSSRNRIKVSDGTHEKEFTQFKKGYYTSGVVSIHDALKLPELKNMCSSLSPSALEVLDAVSKLEGKLDAINTWDNAYLSNGMFQWTIGTSNNSGELGALLLLFKNKYPEKYKEYFGKYGIEPVSGSIDDTVAPIKLFDKKLDRSSKESMRSPEWAFIFWKAAAHCPEYQYCQILHAASRIKKVLSLTVDGIKLGNIFTSEESVAQCLQIHVNRPAYISALVKRAISITHGHDIKRYVDKFTPADREEEQTNLMIEVEKDSYTYGTYPLTHPDVRFGNVRRECLNTAAHSYK